MKKENRNRKSFPASVHTHLPINKGFCQSPTHNTKTLFSLRKPGDIGAALDGNNITTTFEETEGKGNYY